MEDLAYRRLLDLYYTLEGPIPDSDISREIGMNHADEVNTVLCKFFVLTDGAWHNTRCDEEIAAYKAMAEGGKRGAAKRWAKGGDSPPIAPPMPTSNHEPVTSNQEKISVAIATGAKPPPEEIVFGYGVPLLVTAGTAEKHARSFLGKLLREHGPPAVVDALRDCIRAKPLQPLEWLAAALPPKGKSANRQEAIEKANRAVGDRWLAETEQAHAIY